MKKIFLIFAIGVTALSSKVIAQSDAEKNAWISYMMPGDMHKMLATQNGEWDAEVSMWMQPGAPPTKSAAVAKNEMILGGRYQMSKNSGTMMGMPFEGMSVVGYDNVKKMFVSSWVDNFGTGMMYMEGTWDDKTKTITFKGKSTDPMMGKEQDVKEIFQIIDNNTQKMEMFMIMGDNEFKMMEINYKRKNK